MTMLMRQKVDPSLDIPIALSLEVKPEQYCLKSAEVDVNVEVASLTIMWTTTVSLLLQLWLRDYHHA